MIYLLIMWFLSQHIGPVVPPHFSSATNMRESRPMEASVGAHCTAPKLSWNAPSLTVRSDMLPGKHRAGDAAAPSHTPSPRIQHSSSLYNQRMRALSVALGLLRSLLTVIWRSVASKLREIILDFGLSSQDLLGQQVLFVQEEDDGNCPQPPVETYRLVGGMTVRESQPSADAASFSDV